METDDKIQIDNGSLVWLIGIYLEPHLEQNRVPEKAFYQFT